MSTDSKPTKFGLFIYPGFEVLDVFGPLEALNVISRPEFTWVSPSYVEGVTLSVIAQDLEPVSPAGKDTVGSGLAQKIVPAYTLETAPELDVLLVPGGLGSSDVPQAVLDWLQNIFPNLQYLISVCTGADILARAGLLNGLKATTNKQAWTSIPHKASSHKTWWVAHARWVKSSEKIWTTSGVSAGTDGMLAWIDEVYGSDSHYKDIAKLASRWMEYNWDSDSTCDLFSQGLSDVKPTE